MSSMVFFQFLYAMFVACALRAARVRPVGSRPQSSTSRDRAVDADSSSMSRRNVLIKRLPTPRPEKVVTTTTMRHHRAVQRHDPSWEEDDPYAHSLAHDDYFGVKQLFTIRDMMNARVHFGHKWGRLTPVMREYVMGDRLGVCIFDLHRTAEHLKLALNVIAHVAYRRGIILFVTSDRTTGHMVEKTAKEVGEYSHCHPWVRHTFMNTEFLIKYKIRYPDLVILPTCTYQLKAHSIIRECAKLAICTIGVIDSDCQYPQVITYPIPGNDDSQSAIEFYLKMFKAAVLAGKRRRLEEFGADPVETAESNQAYFELMKQQQAESARRPEVLERAETQALIYPDSFEEGFVPDQYEIQDAVADGTEIESYVEPTEDDDFR